MNRAVTLVRVAAVQSVLRPKLYVGPTPAPVWGIRFAVTLLFPQ